MKKKPLILKVIAVIMIISGVLGIVITASIRMYYHLLTFRVLLPLKSLVIYSIVASIFLVLIGMALLKSYNWSRYAFVGYTIIKNALKYFVIGFDVSILPFLFVEMVVIALLFIGPVNTFFESGDTNICKTDFPDEPLIIKESKSVLKILLLIIGSGLVSLFTLLQVVVIIAFGAIVFTGLGPMESFLLKGGLVFVITIFIGIMMVASLLIGYKRVLITWCISFGTDSLMLILVSVIWMVLMYSKLYDQMLRNDFKEFLISSIPHTILGAIIYFILSTVCFRIYKKRQGKL